MKKLITVVLSVFVLFGCSKNRAFYDGLDECRVEETGNSVAAPRMMKANAMMANDSVKMESATVSGAADVSVAEDRKLVKTGNLTIEVKDLSGTEESVKVWCKGLGGYVANSNCGEKSSWFSVRIPAEKFDQAMESCGEFGEVKNRSVSAEDVTEQFYDLSGRLETRRVLREKLQGYLKQAGNMQDMLKIERELNSVQSEIESMEGRMKRLSNQIDFATITINLQLPYNTAPHGGFELPDFGDSFRVFAGNIICFFGRFIAVLFYAVICGIPILAVAALLYWLLFGKIGLLLKLFEKIKRK